MAVKTIFHKLVGKTLYITYHHGRDIRIVEWKRKWFVNGVNGGRLTYVLTALMGRWSFQAISLIWKVKLGNQYYDLYLPLCETKNTSIHKLVSNNRNQRNIPNPAEFDPTQMSSAIDGRPCEHGKGTSEPFSVRLLSSFTLFLFGPITTMTMS